MDLRPDLARFVKGYISRTSQNEKEERRKINELSKSYSGVKIIKGGRIDRNIDIIEDLSLPLPILGHININEEKKKRDTIMEHIRDD